MDITQIICTVITATVGLLVAIIGKRITKSNSESDIQRERRKRESRLSIEMQAATLQLSIVCANALTGGVNNGNVEHAREKAKEAEEAYLAFEREVLSEEISE